MENHSDATSKAGNPPKERLAVLLPGHVARMALRLAESEVNNTTARLRDMEHERDKILWELSRLQERIESLKTELNHLVKHKQKLSSCLDCKEG